MEDDTEHQGTRFLKRLYANCLSENGALEDDIEIRAFGPMVPPPANRFYDTWSGLNLNLGTLSRPSSRNAVYYGVGLRKSGARKGNKAHVTLVPALWADIDVAKLGWNQNETLGALKRHPLKPSVIIHSGYGYHCYWYLSAPAHAQHLGPRIEEANTALADIFDGDTQVTDTARILRVPGSWNCKDERAPKKVKGVLAEWTEHDFWKLYETLMRDGDDIPRLTDLGIAESPEARKARRQSRKSSKLARKMFDGDDRRWTLGTIWSHARYKTQSRNSIGVDEAILRSVAMMYNLEAGQNVIVDKDAIIDRVLYRVQQIKARDAPGERWDWKAERANIADKLVRWEDKYNEQLEQR